MTDPKKVIDKKVKDKLWTAGVLKPKGEKVKCFGTSWQSEYPSNHGWGSQ